MVRNVLIFSFLLFLFFVPFSAQAELPGAKLLTEPYPIAKVGTLYKSSIRFYYRHDPSVTISGKIFPSSSPIKLIRIGREGCCVYRIILAFLPKKEHQGTMSYKLIFSDNALIANKFEKSLQLHVQDDNNPPQFLSSPKITSLMVGEQLSYSLQAKDADNDKEPLTFRLIEAPQGASIKKGILEWKPNLTQVGKHPFVIAVYDTQGAESYQRFIISVSSSKKVFELLSSPPAGATVGQLYLYQVKFQQPVNESVSFKLETHPQGMELHPTIGYLRWLPSKKEKAKVKISIQSSKGKTLSQTWEIQVFEKNQPPNFLAIQQQEVVEGNELSLEINAPDPDKDKVTITCTQCPTGATLQMKGTDKAELRWTPQNSHIGKQELTLQASDQRGGVVDYMFAVLVKNKQHGPQIISSPRVITQAGESYTYKVRVFDEDPNEHITFHLNQAPQGMKLSPNGELYWTPTKETSGVFSIQISAQDNAGESQHQSFQLKVLPKTKKPVITSKPVTSATSDQPYVYSFTVKDDDSKEEELQVRLIQGPLNMQFNKQKKLLSWSPKVGDVGVHSVAFEVFDKQGNKTRQNFEITVQKQTSLPKIISEPVTKATINNTYIYQLQLSQKSEKPITFIKKQGPSTMTLSSSGLLLWNPTKNDLEKQTSHSIVITIRFQEKELDSQAFAINLIEKNTAPTFVNNLPSSVGTNTTYNLPLQVSDVDDDSPVITIVGAPTGMKLNPKTHVLTWKPTLEQIGKHLIHLHIHDLRGGMIYVPWPITVKKQESSITFVSTPILLAYVGKPYSYQTKLNLEQQENIVFSFNKRINGLTFSNDQGTLQWKPTEADIGIHHIKLSAKKGTVEASQVFYLHVLPTKVPFSPSIQSHYQVEEGSPFSLPILPPASQVSKKEDTYFEVSLHQAPKNMVVGQQSGLISWKTTVEDKGKHVVLGAVKDRFGTTTNFSFEVEVLPKAKPLQITSIPKKIAFTGEVYQYQLHTSASGALQYKIITQPMNQGSPLLQITSSGFVSAFPSQALQGTSHLISFEVSKGTEKAIQSFLLRIEEKGSGTNSSPSWTHLPTLPIHVKQDEEYVFQIKASDGDRDKITFHILSSPIEASIDSLSGVFRCKPSAKDVSQLPHEIVLLLEDSFGHQRTYKLKVLVSNKNDPPKITSFPKQNITQGDSYFYELKATDKDGLQDALSFVLVRGPAAMVFNSNNQLLWSPTSTDIGFHFIHLRVTDKAGSSAEQKFFLRVWSSQTAPKVTSSPPTIATEGEIYRYPITFDSSSSTNLSLNLVQSPPGMRIHPETYVITWTPQNQDALQKNHQIILAIEDENGRKGTHQFQITVQNKNNPPQLVKNDCNQVQVGSPFTCTLVFEDLDSQQYALSGQLFQKPDGMAFSLKNTTRKEGSQEVQQLAMTLVWHPQEKDLGTKALVARITDNIATIDFSLSITVLDQKQVPKAKTEQEQTVNPGEVLLDGSKSTDPENRALSYSWKLIDGEQDVQIQDAQKAKAKVILTKSGKYIFELIVHNGLFHSPPARVLVHVRNVSPVVEVFYTYGANVGQQVTLDGSLTVDSNEDELTYQWRLSDGPMETFKKQGKTLHFIPEKPGIYGFFLEVTEKHADPLTPSKIATSEYIQVVVNHPEKDVFPPHLIIAPYRAKFIAGRSYTFDASRTTKPSNTDDPVDFLCDFFQGFFPSSIPTHLRVSTLPHKQTEKILFSPVHPGFYKLRVILNYENYKYSIPKILDILVENSSGKATIPRVKFRKTSGKVGNWIRIDASTSKVNNGTKVSYSWKQTKGPTVEIREKETSTPQFYALFSGHYQFQLIIEEDGVKSPPGLIDIYPIIDNNQAPVANAGPNQIGADSKNAGIKITLDGKDSFDLDDDPLQYRWKQLQGPPVAIQQNRKKQAYFLAHTGSIYKFSLEVTDGKEWSKPSFVQVAVNNPTNHVPIANAGKDQVVNLGQQVSLDGSQSYDHESAQLRYFWRVIDGPQTNLKLNIADPSAPTFSTVNLPKGQYTFGLRVDDGKLTSVEDTVKVVIQGKNTAPIAEIDAKTTMKLGESLRLSGRKSSDPNGDTLSYEWQNTSDLPGQIQNHRQVEAIFIPEEVGTYKIMLVVHDGASSSLPKIIRIEVTEEQALLASGCSCASTTNEYYPSLSCWLLFLLLLRRRSRRKRKSSGGSDSKAIHSSVTG